jgi:pentose-5-phosphate-3-epimerase
MKANLNMDEYREFTSMVDKIKQEKNMSVDHTVMYEIDGTFTVELLGDINLDNLDYLVSTLNN